MPIDVGKRLELAARIGHRREVADVYGKLVLERNLGLGAAFDQVCDLIRGHALIFAEQNLGQSLRIMHTHAAVTVGPRLGREQLALRRIVHVDVVAIGEAELHDAEHIASTRRLGELELPDINARPIDLASVDRASIHRHFEVMTLQHARIRTAAAESEEAVLRWTPQIRQDLFDLDQFGTPQSGWKMMNCMRAEKIGVCVLVLPTMIFSW